MKVVLQKFIADSGYCSRRKAELFIREGKAIVNGKKAELGMKVDDKDVIKVNNKEIKCNKDKIYIMLNKPIGYTCTNRKFEGEKNVFDLVNVEERLFIVGRLDKNSRGLVLLTNDGELTQMLTHPRYEHDKEYEVKLEVESKKLKVKSIIDNFKKGVNLDEGDGIVKVKEIDYFGENKFRVVLTQGKKRQIRRMFKVLGYKVEDILRTRIENLKLEDLREGRLRELDKEEINKLLNC